MTLEASALILAWLAIALLSFAVAGLARQLRILANAGERNTRIGPPIGKPAPAFSSFVGNAPGTKMLLFVDAICPSCIKALNVADQLSFDYPNLRFIAVFDGEPNGYQPERVQVIPNASEAFGDYRVAVKPLAVVVGGDGSVLGSQPIGGEDALRGFAKEAGRLAPAGKE
jgi:hypothetical protein